MANSSSFPPLGAYSSSLKRIYVVHDLWYSDDLYSFPFVVLEKGDGDGEGDATKFIISPHPNTVNPYPILQRFTCVALGSNIYMIGGSCPRNLCPDNPKRNFGVHPHAQVRVFDALLPGDGWKELAPMHIPRTRPSAVVVDGNIYVFGGTNLRDPQDGELYDPNTNQWHQFSAPGCQTRYPLIKALYVDPGGARSIIVNTGCNDELISYPLPPTEKWEIIDRGFGKCHRPGAILDNVIYAFLHNDNGRNVHVRLHGYDLIQKKWFLVEMPPELDGESEICDITAWVIVSSSDSLNLLWFNDEYGYIECYELRIEKSCSDNGSGAKLTNLKATKVSDTPFPVSYLTCLDSILTLDEPRCL